jgi:hypothetical protein
MNMFLLRLNNDYGWLYPLINYMFCFGVKQLAIEIDLRSLEVIHLSLKRKYKMQITPEYLLPEQCSTMQPEV